MNDDPEFIRTIQAGPDDESLRLVYADWLEERGDTRAEFLRLESELARKMDEDCRRGLRVRLRLVQANLDPTWVAMLDRPPIENCENRFSTRCPRRWQRLTIVRDGPVRFCDTCRKEVFFCPTVEAARQRVEEDAPVAVASFVERIPGDVDATRAAMLRRINRTVRECQFLPVDASTLEASVRVHLTLLTPTLTGLGFQFIGDFQMKPEPVVVHDRILLSADGRTLGAICCLLHRGVISMISVLTNGTVVHTCGSNEPRRERTLEPGDQLVLAYMPHSSPRTMYRQHQETIRTQCAERRVEAIAFRPDQYRDVMVYDQRVFNRWRHRFGGLDREPPAPDFSTLQAAPAGNEQPLH